MKLKDLLNENTEFSAESNQLMKKLESVNKDMKKLEADFSKFFRKLNDARPPTHDPSDKMGIYGGIQDTGVSFARKVDTILGTTKRNMELAVTNMKTVIRYTK